MSNKNISLASFINVSFLLLILCFSFNSYSCAHLKNKARSSSRAIIDNKISSLYSVSLLQESSNSTNTTIESTDSLPVNASTIKIDFESTKNTNTNSTADSTSDTSSTSNDSGSPNLSPNITADSNTPIDSSSSNLVTANTDNTTDANSTPTEITAATTDNSTNTETPIINNSTTSETTPITNNSTTTEATIITNNLANTEITPTNTDNSNSTSTETTPTTTDNTTSTYNSSLVSSNQTSTSNESSNNTTTTTPDNTTVSVIKKVSDNSTQTTIGLSDSSNDKLNAEVIITRTNINDVINSINGRVNVVEEIILLPVGMLNKTNSEKTVSTIIVNADENKSDTTNSNNTTTPADTEITETTSPTESENAEEITETTETPNDANATTENTENSEASEDSSSSDQLPASTETPDSIESDLTGTTNLINQTPAQKIASSDDDTQTGTTDTTITTKEETAPYNTEESESIESNTPEDDSIISTDNTETTTSTSTISTGDSNASTQSSENTENSTVTTSSSTSNSTLITEDTFIDNYSEDETDLKTGEVHSIRGKAIITLKKDPIDGTEYLNINSTNITTTTKIDSEADNSDVTIPISHSQANKIKGINDNNTTSTNSDVTPTITLQTGSKLTKRGNKLKATVLLQQNTNTSITANSTIDNTPTEASYFNTTINTEESNTENTDNATTNAKTNNTELVNFMNNEKIRYNNETSLNKSHFEPLCYIFIESNLHRVSYRAELINPFPTNNTSAIEKYLFICEEEFLNIINELNHLRKEEFFSSKLEKELSDFNSKYPPTISTDLSDSFFSYNYYKKNIFKAILVKMGFLADNERPSFDEEYKNTVFINRRINAIIKESFLKFVETYQNKNVNNENLLKQSRSLLDMSYEELIASKAYIKWQTQFLKSNPELNMNEDSVNSKIALIYTEVFNYVRKNKH